MANKANVNVYMPEELKERLQARAQEREISLNALAVQTLQRSLEADPEPLPPVNREVSLEEATQVILANLPVEQRMLILDCSAETGRSPADYLLSYCHLAEERGETATLMSERVHDLVPETPTATPTFVPGKNMQPCEFCQKPFVVQHRGQRFCLDPDDGTPGCGRQAFLRDLHERRPPNRKPEGKNDYSPPQQDTVALQRALISQR